MTAVRAKESAEVAAAPSADDPAAPPEETGAGAAEAVEAAVAEAVGDEEFTVPFRGVDFTVRRDTFGSARFLMAVAQGSNHKILFELLPPEQVDVFVSLLQRGESMPAVASEFLDAVNKAAGWGNDFGKLLGLFAVLGRHHEQLESDLLPKADLLDFWRGKLTARRLQVLIRHLPRTSAFKRAVAGDAGRWGESEHLLATLIDVTAAGSGVEVRIPRPGEEERERRAVLARAAKWEARRARRLQAVEGGAT